MRGMLQQFEWVFQPWTSWTNTQTVGFIVFGIIFQRSIDVTATIIFRRCKQMPRYSREKELRVIDKAHIAFNNLFTVGFLHYLLRYLYTDDNVKWDIYEASPINSFACWIFIAVAYDFYYYVWHTMLHKSTFLFANVHQYHHREVSPFRGSLDALNASPIEYAVTACFIPAGVWTWIYLFGECHVGAVMSFSMVNALLSAANHSRNDVRFWGFDSRHHDIHHKRGGLGGNYAQFLAPIDMLFGTYIKPESVE